MYFSATESLRVNALLKKLKLDGREDIVLIDAGLETKVSASKADAS